MRNEHGAQSLAVSRWQKGTTVPYTIGYGNGQFLGASSKGHCFPLELTTH
jgi:hypothetical protein